MATIFWQHVEAKGAWRCPAPLPPWRNVGLNNAIRRRPAVLVATSYAIQDAAPKGAKMLNDKNDGAEVEILPWSSDFYISIDVIDLQHREKNLASTLRR